MTPELIHEWIAAWNAHDGDRVAGVFGEEFLYEDVTFGVVMRTPQDVKGFVDGFVAVAPDCAFEIGSAFVAGGFGGADWTCTGTHRGDMPGMPASGKRFSLRGATIFELRDGRFSKAADYWDLATLMRQLGFMPA
jgi:steroid delta-isomerase-like uncharacterized protein